MDRKKELLVRAYVVMFTFVVFAIIILYRVFLISVVERDQWKAKGADHIQWRTEMADRGSIYSDDMSLLATTLPFFEIRMDTKTSKQSLWDAQMAELAEKLNHIQGVGDWYARLNKARKDKNQYLLIARNVDADLVEAYKSLPILKEGKYRGGMIVTRTSRREKPFGQLGSRTIGTDRENATKVGLEEAFDKQLKGPEEQRLMRQVAGGVWVPYHDLMEHEVKRGDDVHTTINVTMQDIAHQALSSALNTYEAHAGTAMVMEVKTGAIKAIANLGRTEGGGLAEVYNYAVGRTSEPGSTFKLASTLAMLESGEVDLDTKVNLHGGKKKFYDRWMYDSHQHGITFSNLEEAFEISSNVGIASLAQEVFGDKEGRKQFVKYLSDFGFTKSVGIEIKGEPKPYIKDPVKDKKIWYGTTVPWMSHGYELHMTPLQVLNIYNTVANGGKMMKPYLVSSVQRRSEIVKNFKPRVLNHSIVSSNTVTKAQKLLEGVVERGTAKNLRSDMVTMAGKTGTAVVGYAEEGERRYNASFAGYFPSEAPKYSIMVVIYEPKGKYYGGSVAAPVFKEIAEKVTYLDLEIQEEIAYLNESLDGPKLPSSGVGYKKDYQAIFDYVNLGYKNKSKSTWVEVDPFESKMIIDAKKIKKSLIPDVRGMGVRDALYVLENLGIGVSIEGVGKVLTQSLAPGKKNDGMPIKLVLD